MASWMVSPRFCSQPCTKRATGEKSKFMLDKSKLPMEHLGDIWLVLSIFPHSLDSAPFRNLADSRNRGALDSAEFIIAMYFVKCLMERTISRLPTRLPAWLIAAAAVPVTYPPPPGLPPPPTKDSLIDLDAPLPPLPVSPIPPSRSTTTRHRQSQSSSIVVRPMSLRESTPGGNSIGHSRSSSNPPSGALELPPGRQAPPGLTPTGDQPQFLDHAQGSSEPPPPYSAMEGTSLSA